jgi:hypothetical protein
MATRDHLVAKPTHAPGLLDPIRFREAETAAYDSTHIVGIEMHRADHRRERP